MQVKKQQLEPDMKQQTGSKLTVYCILSLCLFNLYTEYIRLNAWLDEAQTGKSQFSFQFQKKGMPKNTQTTAQLHSSHTLVK